MKYFFILLLFLSSAFAQDFSTRYDVHVSLLGNVGHADIELKESAESYEIKLVATTTGVAAALLKNRVETFVSRGKIVEGKYLPDVFIKTKETTKKSKRTAYYFDHEKREIRVVEEKSELVNKVRFNPVSFELISEEVKKSSKEQSIFDEYKNNDVLSSYLNTRKECNNAAASYSLKAVGAHDDKNDITVSLLQGEEREAAASNFSGSEKEIYDLHVEPFDKDDSIVDVLIVFDNDGLLKEALLGEIFWVGKITAKRVYHKITRN